EPGTGPRNRTGPGSMRRSHCAPTREPCGRGAWIESGPGAEVLPSIHQDIHKGVAHRAGRRESPGVIPVTEDAPSPPEHAVHRARYPDRQSSNAARQGAPVRSLRDEVDVIVLHAELDHPEPAARR